MRELGGNGGVVGFAGAGTSPPELPNFRTPELPNVSSGALERIRTSDPQLRKLVLYPLSYERVDNHGTPRPSRAKGQR